MDLRMRLYEGKASSVILSSGDNGSTVNQGRLQVLACLQMMVSVSWERIHSCEPRGRKPATALGLRACICWAFVRP